MIKTTLPIVEKTIDEEKQTLIVKERNIDVTIDTSLFAEERWEANFPNNAKNETLFAYIERMHNTGRLDDKAHVVSNLKALYCFMEGKDISDFKSFCQLFDLANGDYLNKLIDKIKFVFGVVLNGSAVNSKNF
jgi:hypothetical protein